MNQRHLLVALTLLLSAASARADHAIPDYLTYVQPEMAFDGIAEQADYVFCLRYRTYEGGDKGVRHSVIRIRDSKPFVLDCNRRLEDMKLLAINRTDFEKRSKSEKSLTWLTEKTEGVLAAEVDPPSTKALKKAEKPPLTTYRVKLKDGKLAVETVSRPKVEETNSGGVLPNSMAGLALAAGLASLGLLFVRRRNTRRT
jgi:hypothetical protein